MTPHHRRTPTDRPPAVPPGPPERDAAQQPEELDDARTVLVVHRLDPWTGRCAACAADCPCPPALDAGRVLAQAGAWNTVPFTTPTGRQTGEAPARTRAGAEAPASAGVRTRARAEAEARAEAGWVARLVRRLPWGAAAE